MLGTDLLCFLVVENVFESLLKDLAANDRAILRSFNAHKRMPHDLITQGR